MRVLRFDINRQLLKPSPECDFSGIVPGSAGYLHARFDCDSEWNGCKKAASFFGVDGREHAVPIIDGMCEIPSCTLNGRFFEVRVKGVRQDFVITTNRLVVRQEG